MSATAPDAEFRRQRTLDRYRILDTLPDQTYDDVVKLAAEICDTPIALVSLVDRERQWFKAQVGLGDMTQTERSVAVCDHAIRTPESLFEVGDMREDPRFEHNPIVTGDLGTRFYAGMPLVAPDGEAIGTVCVLDDEPRELTEGQRESLKSLARLTIQLLEGRSQSLEAEREQLLATAAAVPAAAAPAATTAGFTVAIVEIQDFAGAAQRLGDRAFNRALERFDAALETCMRGDAGDAVNRVTGSAESIAVLQGDAVEPRVATLRETAEREAQALGLQVAVAAAPSRNGEEAIGHVYLRADEALSAAKSA